MSESGERLWDQTSRLLLLGAGLALSVFLWDMNNPMPAKNREIYVQTLAMNQQIGAIKSLLREFQKYGEQSPEFEKILEGRDVEKLIGMTIKGNEKH